MEKPVDYYLSLPYIIQVVHEEDGWFAAVKDLPGCMTYADTWDELGAMIEDAMRGWIEVQLEDGRLIPEPVGILHK